MSEERPRASQLVRDALEVQRVHDMMAAVITGEVQDSSRTLPVPMIVLKSFLDALCWMLGHDHNQAAAQNIERIERYLADMGYVLTDSGQLNYPDEEDPNV